MTAASLLPAEGTDLARRLEGTVADVLTGVLGSRQTIYAVRNAVSTLVAGVAARSVGETARQLGMETLLSLNALPALAAPGSRAKVSAAAGRLVSERAGAAMDDRVISGFSDVVQSAVPDAAEAVVRWLRSEETRAYLAERGRELLPRIIGKLTDLQRLFLGAAQLDRRLNERMPEIVDETVAALEKMVRDPRQQDRVAGIVSDAARGWWDSLGVPGDGAAVAQDRRQKLSRAASGLVDGLLARMEDPSERARLAARISARLLEDHRTLGAFARDTLGIREHDIVERTSDLVLRFLTSPDAARGAAARLLQLVLGRITEQPEITLGAALGLGDPARREVEETLRSVGAGLVQRTMPWMREGPSGRGLDLLLGAFGAAVGLVAGAGADLLRAWGLA
ncbi:MAG TPA: hypothetical protein VMQ10_03400 [Spirochaetia bacterium]|nr:hypothetical protein [Spirochaetia bacterium]